MNFSNGSTPRRRTSSGSAGAEPLLVCFSHLRWNFVYQRPQHLLSRAARTFRVVFFEEPVVQEPGGARSDRPLLRLSTPQPGVTVAVPVLPAGTTEEEAIAVQRRMLSRLMDDLGRASTELVAWYYTPMALQFTDELAPDVLVYDCMDELSAFKNSPRKLPELERQLFERADVVFTGGARLYEAKRLQHINVHLFASSIDAVHFGRARAKSVREPVDQCGIARPRIGFFGVIDERMDLGLVTEAAAARPDWQYIMLGPVVKIDPQDLPRRANIHWLGGKAYTDLPTYLAGWDAGFMPFALNDATKFISPTKTPEFLAAGLPVVSTPIADVVRPYGEEGTVAIARDADETVRALDRVMGEPRDPWLEAVDRRLSTMSWDRTWSGMAACIKAVRRRELARRPAAAKARTARREAAGV
jgi:UDP-galactopyranose mutase